jgi:hypothetical protein
LSTHQERIKEIEATDRPIGSNAWFVRKPKKFFAGRTWTTCKDLQRN